jgi:hypothetical protein
MSSRESIDIPYVISEAHPDYKRPYIYNKFGVINPDKMDEFFLEEVSIFIVERTSVEKIQSVSDITKFWIKFYSDSYMDNAPWDARAFINNVWSNKTPNDKLIYEYIDANRSRF